MTDFPAIKAFLRECELLVVDDSALTPDMLEKAWAEYEEMCQLKASTTEEAARRYAEHQDRYEGREITGEL